MELLWYLIFYAALGWALEMAFSLFCRGRPQSRKTMLFLPLCPVYGLGALGILLLYPWAGDHPLLFFFASAGAATSAEYGMGELCLRCWGVRFWDYRHLPCQLRGHVCLPFSLLWGLLALPMTDAVQPILHQLWLATGPGITAGLLAAFLADTICTTLVLERDPRVEALRWWESPPAKGWRTLKSE